MKKRKSAPQPYNRLIGYARVSTREQTLTHQIDALKAAGVHDDNLWVEKVSGVYSRRPQRDLALMDAREGDTFIVWRLDRLSRKIVELYTIVEELRTRGITFLSLQERFDLSTATGKMGFGMAALWADHERNVTIERTASGMKAARARGRQIGREPTTYMVAPKVCTVAPPTPGRPTISPPSRGAMPLSGPIRPPSVIVPVSTMRSLGCSGEANRQMGGKLHGWAAWLGERA